MASRFFALLRNLLLNSFCWNEITVFFVVGYYTKSLFFNRSRVCACFFFGHSKQESYVRPQWCKKTWVSELIKSTVELGWVDYYLYSAIGLPSYVLILSVFFVRFFSIIHWKTVSRWRATRSDAYRSPAQSFAPSQHIRIGNRFAVINSTIFLL